MPEGEGKEMKKVRAMKYEFKVGGQAQWGCPHVKVEYIIGVCGNCGKKFFVCPVCVINNARLGDLCPVCEREAKS
jgi:hypothetical protein